MHRDTLKLLLLFGLTALLAAGAWVYSASPEDHGHDAPAAHGAAMADAAHGDAAHAPAATAPAAAPAKAAEKPHHDLTRPIALFLAIAFGVAALLAGIMFLLTVGRWERERHVAAPDAHAH